MLETVNLCAGYGKKQILHGVNIAFEYGKITAVTGPNASGKSTLLKAIMRLADIQSGSVMLDGKNADTLSVPEFARLVSYLPQSRNVPDITASRMALHGRFPYLSYPRRYSEKDYEAVEAALEKMGISDVAQQSLCNLSGGTRQKVYIATALVQDTQTVIMDEPAASLDIAHTLQLMKLAGELAESGKAVVIVLHDLPLALKYAHRIAVMDNGRIAAFGTPQEIVQCGCIKKVFSVELKSTVCDGETQYFCVGR